MEVNRRVERLNYFLASIVFIIGISGANVYGLMLEAIFYSILLFLGLLYWRKFSGLLTLSLFLLLNLIFLVNPFYRDFEEVYSLYLILPIIEGYILAIFLFHVLKMKSVNALKKVLYFYLFFQAVVVVIFMLVPELRNNYIDWVYIDENQMGDAFWYALSYRGYGISRHYLFGFPLAVAFMGIILYLLEDSIVKKFLLVIITSFICVLNARTPIFIFLFSIAFFELLLMRFLNLKYLFKFFMALAILSVALFTILTVYPNEWITNSFSIFYDISKNETVIDLISMIHYPKEAYALLFGYGIKLVQFNSEVYSDIGYIRALYLGGAGFLIVLLLGFTIISSEISKSFCKKNYIVGSIVVIMFLFASLIKGESYILSDISRLIYFLFFYSIFERRLRCEKIYSSACS